MTDGTLNIFADRPVFAGFLIDASGSMGRFQNDVIAGHKLMLNTLRDSEKCEKGVLYIYQSLFSDTVNCLHGFYPLSPDGKDNIVPLSQGNYRPAGFTHLYDAVIAIIRELETQMEYGRKRGFRGSARIAIITDGEENKSTATAAQVKTAITQLRDREWLESSIVIGLTNPEFTHQMLESLRDAIGFAQAIGLNQEPSKIRRAFVLASKPKPD